MKNLVIFIGLIGILISFAFVTRNSGKKNNINPTCAIEHNDVCPDCNGAGNRICTTCNGNQTVTIKYECNGCYARGTVPCTDNGCNGSGYVACTYQLCNNGLVTGGCSVCYGKSAEEIANCRKCSGSGTETIQCIYCAGRGEKCHTSCNCSGQKTCPTCYGDKILSREASCGRCEGNGYTKCQRCNGTGEVK
jgi:hypothetical protein